MLKTLAKLFGRGEEAAVRRYLPVVQRINELEPQFERLSDEALRAKTEEFRARLREGETLDALLPEAFAAVREASKRTIGLRHFDVQLIGGIVLHEGKVAEMKTGEGKTLVATLPVYLNALLGRGVHVVTVNDYLSRRDAGWMGPIYHALGLRVASIAHDFSGLYDPAYQDPKPHADDRLNHFRPISRREAYLADITYGTNNEFGFDYLRDNMALRPEDIVQRELYYAIVDEVDFILIDEARTPLIISGQVEESTRKYYEFARLVRRLRPGEDYTVDEKLKTATLTETGIRRVEQMLGVDNLTDPEHLDLMHHIHQALRAHACYKRDVDYVVKDGQVIIVDEFTGRLMFGRRYADGLHQAIEAKEGVRIERETQTLATITLQNYFRMYEKLAGMTGTAKTEEEELRKIYGLEVVVIPTHKPMIRVDYPDLVFKTEAAKWRAVVREIQECYQKGRPVLVGTRSIEKSEMLSRMLRQEGIPHQVLNAKYHEREAEIIAQAGRLGAVTIATNMAGRGVDILLGGNPPDPEEAEKVRQLGGLHVIGTERHEARRIDNQLRGRSGRQGDPGSSRFYVSAEDELLRLFGGERIAAVMDRFRIDEDTPIESPLLTRQIEAAQKRVEQYHFDIRKHLLEYDDVMNVQRQTIYRERRKVLFGENLRENVLDMMERVVGEVVEAYCPASLPREEWDLEGMLQELAQLAPVPEVLAISPQDLVGRPPEEIRQILTAAVLRAYEAKEEAVGPEVMREVERVVLLSHIDRKWIDHLYAMDELREGIGLRAYGQVSPLVEYQREAYEMFQQMLRAIQVDTVRDLLRVRVEREIPRALRPVARVTGQAGPDADRVLGALATSPDSPAASPKPQPVVVGAKVGRNDPCPCGSGRKYKKCCGRES
ncbi:MAG: preprotein translocase subunit SecA [Armatimonadota bacterium]|nr:preprotein translocase subunit SecA [Armatimonadota bacterium]MDR7444568.1 preprotein translocase subunit SecA [Armatimonadota bacterium]MDR7570336.1 preprotein translocase subunit SecA [Armatimonadota bacterium]MDR7615358.1 preprotein translocase subunit SecA [Armatimonadota bacterium]